MGKRTPLAKDEHHLDLVQTLIQTNFLFKGFESSWLATYLPLESLKAEKFFSSRPIYTAFQPGEPIQVLYALVSGGPVIVRSTPLDRVIGITYPGSCFGMRNLPVAFGGIQYAFPSLVEAYKTANVITIPLTAIQNLYQNSQEFQDRYHTLFELREKFQYHLLNCSAYPPQAVASLLRALIYQERELGNQPTEEGFYLFDLPIDIIARASQLNQRTVEQVLKGMSKVGLLQVVEDHDSSSDLLRVVAPEMLKEVYGTTRDKVHWWPLR
ncbi:MAG: Crp/Fnr family transcriptional regulator [Cyanobacteriota bacterium]|nr:Crp/Fnr family transcriptional regulator [Cyanobacteriota bacterium]